MKKKKLLLLLFQRYLKKKIWASDYVVVVVVVIVLVPYFIAVWTAPDATHTYIQYVFFIISAVQFSSVPFRSVSLDDSPDERR